MDRMKIGLSVLVGLTTAGVFAAEQLPVKIINTLGVGYDDNVYHRDSEFEKTSAFVSDTIDISYHAAFSDRTDLMLKSRVNVQADKYDTDVYPHLFATLNHSVSPRVLLGLSEHFQSGNRTGLDGPVATDNKRYSYYENTAGVSSDYLVNEKNRLNASADYTVLRNEDDDTTFTNDYTTIAGGLAWNHEVVPQRTFSSVNVRQRYTDYDNRDASFDATDLYLGLGHTFNPEWKCNLNLGGTYVSPDVQGAVNDSSLNPLIAAGLVYSPSPLTELSANADYRYSESGDSRFGGQNTLSYSLGAQHDLTAKLDVKATARLTNVEYDADSSAPGTGGYEEDRMDLDLRLTYKLNRMHALVAGIRHSQKDRDDVANQDWTQNVVDFGWRVELN